MPDAMRRHAAERVGTGHDLNTSEYLRDLILKDQREQAIAHLRKPVQEELAANPAPGSPVLGRSLGIDGLRTRIVDGFPPSYWYVERPDSIDIVRLLDHRQAQAGLLGEAPPA